MRVVLAAWGLSFVWLGVVYVRQRLVADPIGVRVRNPLSSFSLRWDEIDRFEPPPPQFSRQGFGRRYGLAIVTTDGRRLHSALWGQSRVDLPGFADPVVAALSELKARYDPRDRSES